MLPPMEDPGLAARATEGKFGVQDLLLFSSVCGLGLDTVPIPGTTACAVLCCAVARVSLIVDCVSGDVNEASLRHLLADVCCMAFRVRVHVCGLRHQYAQRTPHRPCVAAQQAAGLPCVSGAWEEGRRVGDF